MAKKQAPKGPSITDQVVIEVAGEDVVPLVKYLKDRKNISEFKIAESLKREVNETRNMLYRLYENNLVTFMRKKDKTKGWYIYYWTFNEKRAKYLSVELKRKKVVKLKERLEREREGNFFGCRNKCIRLSFDQATDFNFKCPECGSVLDHEDNQSVMANIHLEIAALEKEIHERTPKEVPFVEEPEEVPTPKSKKAASPKQKPALKKASKPAKKPSPKQKPKKKK